jgi:hypothetical protein
MCRAIEKLRGRQAGAIVVSPLNAVKQRSVLCERNVARQLLRGGPRENQVSYH